jgi:L-rhamnose-H+ transport protein
VNLGLTASTGSLVPLAVLFPARLVSSSAVALYVGVGTMLGGLILSSQAGRLRQAGQAPDEITSGADVKAFGKGNVRTGLIVCVAAGFLSSMLNLAFAFGDNVRVTALRLGASAPGAVNTLWLPILISGFIPTLIYCAYLLNKNQSWSAFIAPGVGSHWCIAVLMGLLFLGALSLYGIASVRLGAMGPVLGFPIFMSTIVLTGNTAGLLTGEWRGASKISFIYWFFGMLLLILSIVIIGIGNTRVG